MSSTDARWAFNALVATSTLFEGPGGADRCGFGVIRCGVGRESVTPPMVAAEGAAAGAGCAAGHRGDRGDFGVHVVLVGGVAVAMGTAVSGQDASVAATLGGRLSSIRGCEQPRLRRRSTGLHACTQSQRISSLRSYRSVELSSLANDVLALGTQTTTKLVCDPHHRMRLSRTHTWRTPGRTTCRSTTRRHARWGELGSPPAAPSNSVSLHPPHSPKSMHAWKLARQTQDATA